jgi:toxin ParE1/3/4
VSGRLVAEARPDLSEIWDHHAKSVGRRNADEIVRGIRDATRVIEDHPCAGRARDEIRPGLRTVPARPYIVFYRIRGGVAQVARILHGRRDLGEILAEDSTDT